MSNSTNTQTNDITEEPAFKKVKAEKAVPQAQKEEAKRVVKALERHIESHDNSRKEVQEKLHTICDRWRKEVDELEDKVSNELEAKFKEEDSCLQSTLNNLQTSIFAEEAKITEALQKAKGKLLFMQKYQLDKIDSINFTERLKLNTKKIAMSETLDFSKGRDVKVSNVSNGKVFLNLFDFTQDGKLNEEVGYTVLLLNKEHNKEECEGNSSGDKEDEVGSEEDGINSSKEEEGTSNEETKDTSNKEEDGGPKSSEKERKENSEGKEYPLKYISWYSFFFEPDFLEAEATYIVKIKAILQGKQTEWDEEAEFTPKFTECCVWKECPDCVNKEKKYYMDKKNPMIVSKVSDYGICTIIGTAALPLKKVTSWKVKVLEPNDGMPGIYIGVAPYDIDQNEGNLDKKPGWYLNCSNVKLWSNSVYKDKDEGRVYTSIDGFNFYKNFDQISEFSFKNGLSVCMNTEKGQLSFWFEEEVKYESYRYDTTIDASVSCVDESITFNGIPLDRPIVPCVLLNYKGDSVELII